MTKFYCFIITLLLANHLSAQNYVEILPTDTEQDIIRKAANVKPTAEQLAWQKLEITGFLHFGINTYTGREWGEGKDSPELFNPSNLDTDQWVRVAKEAGIKLLILTAKHHDGFCLWPTATTSYSLKSSSYKNGQGDILRELVNSCKKYNIKIGVYLSPWDRNASSYGSNAYNDMFLAQLSEVLTNYGKIDEVWFDGANGEGPNGKKQDYDWNAYYGLIRKLQPKAVIAVMGPDVRWVGTETGYGRDTEWSVVPIDNLNQNKITENSQQQMNVKPTGNLQDKDVGGRQKIKNAKGLAWYPAETDVSIRPGWFYHEKQDAQVKSPEKLLDIYFNSVGKNGVLLLNIPPNKEGLIQQSDQESLRKWKLLRDEIFRKNILTYKGTKTIIDKHAIHKVKHKGNSYWTNKLTEQSTMTFEYQLAKEQTFNILQLSEYIALGQRVEAFQLEAEIDGQWKEIANGTTIGYKRILTFPSLKANKIRFSITGSRLNPNISEIGLFYYAAQK